MPQSYGYRPTADATPGTPPREPAGASGCSLPTVQGRCPACGRESLFLGDGGYVTCSRVDCTEPDAASTLLERDPTIAPTACGLVTPGIGGRYLGPCTRAPHDDHVHHDATGARWWPVDGGVVTAPAHMTDQEIAELRARWTASAGRDVAITVMRQEV